MDDDMEYSYNDSVWDQENNTIATPRRNSTLNTTMKSMTSMTSTHRSIGSKSNVSNVQNRIQRGNRGFSFLQALDTQIMMIEAGDRCVAGNGYVLLPTVFNNGTEIDNAVTMESSAPISLNKKKKLRKFFFFFFFFIVFCSTICSTSTINFL